MKNTVVIYKIKTTLPLFNVAYLKKNITESKYFKHYLRDIILLYNYSMKYYCKYCYYSSERKYNIERHMEKMHSNNERNESEDIQTIMYCNKCYKQYKTKKSLLQHQEQCCGIDKRTCPRCMTTFKHIQSKYRHMKDINCEINSMAKYKNPNLECLKIPTKDELNTDTVINIIINNFGSERIDYISEDNFIDIFKSSYIIPNYIELKHFNPKFPENHNIRYDGKLCFIKSKDEWKIADIQGLAMILLENNSKEMMKKYEILKDKIEESIQDIGTISKSKILETIQSHINHTLLQSQNLEKIVIKRIKDIIRTSNFRV